MSCVRLIAGIMFIILTTSVHAVNVNLYDKKLAAIPNNIRYDATTLNLEKNDISEVTGDNIWNLTRVTYVNLNHNDLTVFPNITGPANTLTNLYISYNQLDTIPMELINKLKKLNILTLTGNRLSAFPDAPNLSLTQLYLQQNLFIRLPRLMKAGTNLQRLDIYSNSINTTIAEDFLNLTKLAHLDLRNNKLTYFPNLTYVDDTLVTLYLSSNEIAEIPSDIFNKMTMLSNLYISKNKIQYFPNTTEISLTLRTVVLEGNAFSRIPLIINHSLYSLSLRNNYITNTTSDDFLAYQNLEILNLDINQITVFPNLTHMQHTLRNLYLGNNQIGTIDFRLVEILQNLRLLYLYNNRISYFPDQPTLRSLTHLNLAGNFIQSLPEFSSLGQSLLLLYMNGQQTGLNVSNEALSLLTTPQQIHLGSNSLTEFPDFRNIDTDLSHLSINHNKITSIPAELFSFPNRIGSLHITISSNSIETFPKLYAPHVTYLYLDARHNPIVCDNALSWLHQLPHKRIYLYCSQPEALKSRAFDSLKLEDISGKYNTIKTEWCVNVIYSIL